MNISVNVELAVKLQLLTSSKDVESRDTLESDILSLLYLHIGVRNIHTPSSQPTCSTEYLNSDGTLGDFGFTEAELKR